MLTIARKLHEMGFMLFATRGTQAFLQENGLQADFVFKVNEGRPNMVDRMVNGEVSLIINTPLGKESYFDERIVGETAYRIGLPVITTLSAAEAGLDAIRRIGQNPLQPFRLQDIIR